MDGPTPCHLQLPGQVSCGHGQDLLAKGANIHSKEKAEWRPETRLEMTHSLKCWAKSLPTQGLPCIVPLTLQTRRAGTMKSTSCRHSTSIAKWRDGSGAVFRSFERQVQRGATVTSSRKDFTQQSQWTCQVREICTSWRRVTSGAWQCSLSKAKTIGFALCWCPRETCWRLRRIHVASLLRDNLPSPWCWHFLHIALFWEWGARYGVSSQSHLIWFTKTSSSLHFSVMDMLHWVSCCCEIPGSGSCGEVANFFRGAPPHPSFRALSFSRGVDRCGM